MPGGRIVVDGSPIGLSFESARVGWPAGGGRVGPGLRSCGLEWDGVASWPSFRNTKGAECFRPMSLVSASVRVGGE